MIPEAIKYAIVLDGGTGVRKRRGSMDRIRIEQLKWKIVRFFVEGRGVLLFFRFKEKRGGIRVVRVIHF